NRCPLGRAPKAALGRDAKISLDMDLRTGDPPCRSGRPVLAVDQSEIELAALGKFEARQRRKILRVVALDRHGKVQPGELACLPRNDSVRVADKVRSICRFDELFLPDVAVTQVHPDLYLYRDTVDLPSEALARACPHVVKPP